MVGEACGAASSAKRAGVETQSPRAQRALDQIKPAPRARRAVPGVHHRLCRQRRRRAAHRQHQNPRGQLRRRGRHSMQHKATPSPSVVVEPAVTHEQAPGRRNRAGHGSPSAARRAVSRAQDAEACAHCSALVHGCTEARGAVGGKLGAGREGTGVRPCGHPTISAASQSSMRGAAPVRCVRWARTCCVEVVGGGSNSASLHSLAAGAARSVRVRAFGARTCAFRVRRVTRAETEC